MKALQNYITKIKPNFEKGGKYEKWLPVFDSFETFVFVLGNTAPKKGAHIRDAMDLKRTMITVVYALIPALLFGIWNTGYQQFLSTHEIPAGVAAWDFFWGHPEGGIFMPFLFGASKVVPLIIVAYVAGLGTEFVFVYLKGKEIEEGYLVSGLLIPMVVPVDVPLWMVALAAIFAVVIGKEVFGGTGMNIVNVALLARAFLFFAYPSKMSGDKIWISGLADGNGVVDGFSGATALGQVAGATELSKVVAGEAIINTNGSPMSVFDMFVGLIPGSIGETSTLAILIGAAILIFTGIASWKIIFSAVAGGAAMGLLLNTFATETNPYMALPFYEHLLLGGFAFGVVFMATDPVSATQTETGKWIYGFLIGFISILIRVLNPAYPEGVMLAILFMNVFAPLIDHYVVSANIKRRLKRAVVKA